MLFLCCCTLRCSRRTPFWSQKSQPSAVPAVFERPSTLNSNGPIKMADMVQKFSAVTLSNEILNYAIVTKMNEGSSLIIIQKFIIFFKSFNLHREHRNIVNHLGFRLISSGCSIHRLRRALFREPLLLPEETNRTHLYFVPHLSGTLLSGTFINGGT